MQVGFTDGRAGQLPSALFRKEADAIERALLQIAQRAALQQPHSPPLQQPAGQQPAWQQQQPAEQAAEQPAPAAEVQALRRQEVDARSFASAHGAAVVHQWAERQSAEKARAAAAQRAVAQAAAPEPEAVATAAAGPEGAEEGIELEGVEEAAYEAAAAAAAAEERGGAAPPAPASAAAPYDNQHGAVQVVRRERSFALRLLASSCAAPSRGIGQRRPLCQAGLPLAHLLAGLSAVEASDWLQSSMGPGGLLGSWYDDAYDLGHLLALVHADAGSEAALCNSLANLEPQDRCARAAGGRLDWPRRASGPWECRRHPLAGPAGAAACNLLLRLC